MTDPTRSGRTDWLQLGAVCAAQFAIWTGFSGILPYLPIFLLDEGHSSVAMIGFIAASFYLGTILFSSLFGWLSDMVGRKPMMIAGMVLVAVASFLFTRTVDPRWFLLFRLLEGMSAAAGGVMFAFVADISVPAQRSRALGMVMSAQFGGAIAGPALGAVLYNAAGGGKPGFYAIFYFGAAAGLATAIVMVFLLHEPEATRRRKDSRTERERRPDYGTVVTPAIRGFLIVSASAFFGFGGFEVIWSLWLQHLGASMTTISVMWVVMGVPMVLSFLGGVLADRHDRFALMFAGNAVAALLFLITGLSRSIPLYFVIMVVSGLGYAVSSPAKQGFMVQVSPQKWIGTVQGLDSTAAQIGGLAGTLVIPALYGLISGYVIIICGVVAGAGLLIAAPALARENARLKRMLSAPGEAAEHEDRAASGEPG
jgi:MFS family permease